MIAFVGKCILPFPIELQRNAKCATRQGNPPLSKTSLFEYQEIDAVETAEEIFFGVASTCQKVFIRLIKLDSHWQLNRLHRNSHVRTTASKVFFLP